MDQGGLRSTLMAIGRLIPPRYHPGRFSGSPPGFARGLTVLELCAFVSVVAVMLSGMVSLARHLKSRGAEELTRERMEQIVQRARSLWNDPEVVEPIGQSMSESNLLTWATRSSSKLSAALAKTDPSVRPELFFDAWGTPIGLVAGGGRLLGIPPDDSPFLISAGPDRQFLSLGDNLYSYDLVAHSVTNERVVNSGD